MPHSVDATVKRYVSWLPLTLLATWTLGVTSGAVVTMPPAGVDRVVVGVSPSSRPVPP